MGISTELRRCGGRPGSALTPGRAVALVLDSDILRDHCPQRFPDILQESRILLDEGPTDLGRKVDVAFLLNQAEHLRTVEDVEQFLELAVRKFAEALMNREVLAQFLPD